MNKAQTSEKCPDDIESKTENGVERLEHPSYEREYGLFKSFIVI